MTTPENITHLEPDEIFVFGSNLAGRHGKGAALVAKQKFGAKQGQCSGFTGQCYAIPTKDRSLNTLPLDKIKISVSMFLWQATHYNTDLTFLVTPIGCGLAGYTPEQIAPMFADAPPNVILPASFQKVLKP